MIELDEFGDLMAWLFFGLLAILAAWWSRPALLAAGGAGREQLRAWRDGKPGAPGRGIAVRARLALQSVLHPRQNGNLSSGNQSFDNYRSDALRKLDDEQREFREFRKRLCQARDRSEFDAFMAERGGR